MKKINIAAIIGVPAIALLMATNAHATVTMQLNQGETYKYSEGGFTASIGSTTIITGNDLIGIYAFNILPNSDNTQTTPSLTGPLYTTCVTPAGLLDWNSHTYDVITLTAAGTGLSSYTSTPYTPWQTGGILQANYLFSLLSPQITTGGISGQAAGVANQGAALALAMYAALYGSAFSVALSGDVYNDYYADLKYLNPDPSNLGDGYLLRPNPNRSGSGQDQIFLAAALPQGYGAVPEPSTILAGALLLLPFGVSALRILRKK